VVLVSSFDSQAQLFFQRFGATAGFQNRVAEKAFFGDYPRSLCSDPNCQSCKDLREAQEKVKASAPTNHGENRAAINSDREVLWLPRLGWQCVQEEIPTLSFGHLSAKEALESPKNLFVGHLSVLLRDRILKLIHDSLSVGSDTGPKLSKRVQNPY
jgi:hypothetical protein